MPMERVIQDFRLQLGKAVRQRRKAMELSQEAFAERLDVHRNYVGLIERGQQNITLETLVKLCRAFGCQPADLVPGIPLDRA